MGNKRKMTQLEALLEIGKIIGKGIPEEIVDKV